MDEWQRVAVDRNAVPTEIELANAAKTQVPDPEESILIEIKATLVSYLLYVNAAPTSGPHVMGCSIAITVAAGLLKLSKPSPACRRTLTLSDGEAIACDENRLAVFELIRRQHANAKAVHCAFDLLELDGEDLRRETA